MDARDAAPDAGSRKFFGAVFNPKEYPWEAQSAVHRREHGRLQQLRQQWYGSSVGDGADAVLRKDLDPWQRFAYDVVCDHPTVRAPGEKPSKVRQKFALLEK